MIYSTEQRAIEVADMLNKIPGHPPAKALLRDYGWTVVSSYYH